MTLKQFNARAERLDKLLVQMMADVLNDPRKIGESRKLAREAGGKMATWKRELRLAS